MKTYQIAKLDNETLEIEKVEDFKTNILSKLFSRIMHLQKKNLCEEKELPEVKEVIVTTKNKSLEVRCLKGESKSKFSYIVPIDSWLIGEDNPRMKVV